MRRLWFPLGAAALVVLEVAVLVQVAQLIGWWTLPLLLVTSFVGGLLVKRAGVRSMSGLRKAMQTGAGLDRELADTGVVLAGGLLVALPGFVTDLAGIVFVLPPMRPLARRLFLAVLGRQIANVERAMPSVGGYSAGADAGAQPPGPAVQGDVVQGRVVSRDNSDDRDESAS